MCDRRNRRRGYPTPSSGWGRNVAARKETQEADHSPQAYKTRRESKPLTLTVPEVGESLAAIKRRSPGPNSIPYWIFRSFSRTFASVVTYLFNRSLSEGHVTLQFKRANITPILKLLAGNTKIASDFRPISLLSILAIKDA